MVYLPVTKTVRRIFGPVFGMALFLIKQHCFVARKEKKEFERTL
jgi:hypothetical protein